MRKNNSRIQRRVILFVLLVTCFFIANTQVITDTTAKVIDSIQHAGTDTSLRIKNLNPFFNIHADSSLNYNLELNRDESKYYWYLRNSPVGLKVNKDNGMLSFKAEKSFFLSGKLKYDNEYKVFIGVQNLENPKDKIDTFFSIVIYNTEIIPSRIKPTVNALLTIEEGDTVSFKVQCENGSFPIENITFYANTPLKNFTLVRHCDDEFVWSPAFDFVKEMDSAKVKIVTLSFVGTNRFMSKDTAIVRIVIKDALNYPLALQDYNLITKNINSYIVQLKNTFLQLDKSVKRTKGTRTTFDITSSSTALTGTILASSSDESTKKTGQILPSVGVSLVPIKEAVAPQKIFDQNQAALIRTSVKRLQYMLGDNAIVGEKDPDIVKKTNKLKDELKQIQIQLIEIPLDIDSELSESDLNQYFNSPKVNKKYRLKK